MKVLFKNIILLSSFIFLLASCEKEETRIVAKSNAAASKLTASQTSIVLDEATANNEAVAFSFSPTDFGYSAAASYALEFGKKDSNFVNGKIMDLGSSLETKLTVSALNAIANQIRLKGFEANEMEVRVKAEIGGGAAPVYSNVVRINITPYLDKPPYQTLYLVGDATDNGWNTGSATPVFRDPLDPFLFVYTGNFAVGSFKYLSTVGQGTPQWGSNGNGGVAFRATEANADPASFSITSAGYYKVVLNLKNSSISITPYNASAAKLYASIGIIGEFNGWSTLIPMTKSELNPHIWNITHTFSSDTRFKFRIAEGWEENWGAGSGTTANNPYDIGSAGGTDINVKAGTYRIRFNDLTQEYILIRQ